MPLQSYSVTTDDGESFSGTHRTGSNVYVHARVGVPHRDAPRTVTERVGGLARQYHPEESDEARRIYHSANDITNDVAEWVAPALKQRLSKRYDREVEDITVREMEFRVHTPVRRYELDDE